MINAKEPKTDHTKVEGVRLFYEMAGEGPNLVFVHAGCADRRMWDGQFPVFGQQYRVLRYDMRGYGNSTLTRGPFSNRRDLYGLLEALHIPKAHFVACSIGSQTALDFALEHPEKVASLTLVSPAVSGYPYEGPPPQPVLDLIAARQSGDLERAAEIQAQLWADGLKRKPGQADAQVHELVREMSLDALNLQANIIRETTFLIEEPLQPPAMQRLEQVTAPTLAIAGDLDDGTVLEAADLLARRVPGAKKAIIPEAAHLPSMEKPAEFNQIVLEFLKKI